MGRGCFGTLGAAVGGEIMNHSGQTRLWRIVLGFLWGKGSLGLAICFTLVGLCLADDKNASTKPDANRPKKVVSYVSSPPAIEQTSYLVPLNRPQDKDKGPVDLNKAGNKEAAKFTGNSNGAGSPKIPGKIEPGPSNLNNGAGSGAGLTNPQNKTETPVKQPILNPPVEPNQNKAGQPVGPKPLFKPADPEAQQNPANDVFKDRPRMGMMGQPGPLQPNQALGMTPKPNVQTLDKYRKYVEAIEDPDNTLDLVIGRPRIITFKEMPAAFQAVDPRVVSAEPLEGTGGKTFFILGNQVGTSVLVFFFEDAKDPTKFQKLHYLVRVVPDPEAKDRLERTYSALEKEVNRMFPDSSVQLHLVGDKLVVRGQAKDIYEAGKILQVIRANVPQDQKASRIPVDRVNVNVNVDPNNPDATVNQGLENFLLSGESNIINMLRVPGEQQVALRVTVAEVNRKALRSIGMNFNIFNNAGRQIFGQQTGGILAAGAANLPVLLDNGQVILAINALRNLNFARTLAETNLVSTNGQTAEFSSGGSFPVPVVTGFTNSGLQGVNFVPFGVQLRFTPTVSDKDRIRLTISTEVSTRDNSQQSSINGTNVPGLLSNRFSNVVEMREGQTLAVAGLIQNNHGAVANRVPLFGDLPYIGRAFAFDQTSSGEQELVVLISPELIQPLEHREVPPLPGHNVYEPGDVEFYLRGRLESRRTEDYRAGTRTDINRMLNYKKGQDTYITGPYGTSDGSVVPMPMGTPSSAPLGSAPTGMTGNGTVLPTAPYQNPNAPNKLPAPAPR